MFKGKVLLFSLLLVFATSVYAGDVDDCFSYVYLSCDAMRLSICPNGDFEYIRDACVGGGSGGYIGVVAKNASNQGVPGIPWSDYWIGACDPAYELCLCCDAFVSDSLTNANGETTISGRIAGGGCVLEGGIYICIQGKVILDDHAGADPNCLLGDPICLNMIIVSPDLTADCWVNLSDLGTFGPSYNKCYPDPAFNPCCDFNDDTCCNLSDFAYMGGHYQHHCETCP